MITPRLILLTLRLGTAACVLGLGVLTIGPFQGLEGALGLPDKTAHALAFFALTLAVFASAPRWRRTDLALMVLGLGLVLEIVQGVVGRSLSLGDWLADAFGVTAALVPAWIERLRDVARRHPHASLGAIRDMDRRQGRRDPVSRGMKAGVAGSRRV